LLVPVPDRGLLLFGAECVGQVDLVWCLSSDWPEMSNPSGHGQQRS